MILKIDDIIAGSSKGRYATRRNASGMGGMGGMESME